MADLLRRRRRATSFRSFRTVAVEGRFPHDLKLIQDYLGHRDPKHTVHWRSIRGNVGDMSQW